MENYLVTKTISVDPSADLPQSIVAETVSVS
jgi:hypothetical protein